MPKTVILVDESKTIRESIKTILAAAGYQVLTAEDGAKGLQVCQQQRADLILSDLNLPNLEGITFIGQLRALSQYRYTPILALTTAAQEEQKVAGKKIGATGWILKPFIPACLLAVVQRVCPSLP